MRELPKIIHESWHPFLSHALFTEDMDTLSRSILPNCIFYPEAKNIFRVFSMPLQSIKVVVLGQDPYPQPNQAIGYAFAVNMDVPAPKSLQIIAKEVFSTCYGDDVYPEGYPSLAEWKTLEHWTDQGVFLLNTSLTVEKGKIGSHVRNWEDFIKHILGVISSQVNPIWILWGLHAQKHESIIRRTRLEDYGNILKAPHPAAEVYANGKAGFYGSNHFQKTNQILINKNNNPIIW